MLPIFFAAVSRLVARANDNDALIPEIWAPEALMTLMSNTVMASLVYRDFSADLANYGDVVNTSRPSDFSGKRKTDSDNVTQQDAISTNIRVPLDQWFHVTFVINDGEMSKALPDLLERYMEPAARELAEKIDQILAGQAAQLLANQVGEPGGADELTVDGYILDADEKLNDNKCPRAGRNLVMSSRFNRAALSSELVVEADKRGDEGTALREANVGRIYGFDSYMDQNVENVAAVDADSAAGVPDSTIAEGATAVPSTVTFSAGNTIAGCYVSIEGSEYGHRASNIVDSTGDCDITLESGVTAEIPVSAEVVVYNACNVNLAAGYAAGYAKEINVDGYTAGKAPQKGQIVSFGTGGSTHTYTVIDVTDNGSDADILLDRPLDAALVDDDACFPGHKGSKNLAFHRDAIALVSRPLSTSGNGRGASMAVASFDNLSMRVTMQYDSEAQGMRVTMDMLCGVAVLDDRLGCVVNG